MAWSVRSKIIAQFGLAVAVFIGVGVLSFQVTETLIHASQERQVSYQTLDTLNDTRLGQRSIALALRAYLLSGEESHFEAMKKAQVAIETPLKALHQRLDSDAEQKPQLDKAEAVLRDYIVAALLMADTRRTKGQAPATAMFLAEDTRHLLDNIESSFATLQGSIERVVSVRETRTEGQISFVRRAIIFGNLAAVLLALFAVWRITRDIATPLSVLTRNVERVTAGDLSDGVSLGKRADELGVLGRAIERMVQSLRDTARTADQIATGDLRGNVKPQSEADVLGNAFLRMSTDLRSQLSNLAEGISVLSASATEIVASSSQLAASATQSAAAVSQTTTTVEEVRHTAQLASQKARLVADSAQRAAQVTENGRRSTHDVETGMGRIRDQMDKIASGMVQLSEQSQAVGQVIAAVEDLATQSNMLAVNAAIEAAKAGEHGKGFGVVAQEVRSLAEQSRQATNQVRSLLGDIQKATAAAVMATEEGGKVVHAGTRQAEAAGEAVQTLGTSVDDAVQAALQIAASSQQQLVGMDQMVDAMNSIKQATSQNVASAAQLQDTARNIGDIGQRLKRMVDAYQV